MAGPEGNPNPDETRKQLYEAAGIQPAETNLVMGGVRRATEAKVPKTLFANPNADPLRDNASPTNPANEAGRIAQNQGIAAHGEGLISPIPPTMPQGPQVGGNA